ncbi:MAG TPA: NAD-dependent epimerase/dehydratase family protein [Spongiibacteraceae bacterium]|nr:NAD-dependent epimerase/dehydratase family protein [Spongiibacteraceae bacterium]
MKKKRIFITGGAGFIGSRLTRALLSNFANYEVAVFDNLHPQVHGTAPVVPEFPKGCKFILGDVTDENTLTSALTEFQPELVFHLAAETGTGQSYDEPARYCNVNVMGTTFLIQAIRKCRSVRHVVLAASRAIYGEGAYTDAKGNEFIASPRLLPALAAGDFDVPVPSNVERPASPTASHAKLAPMPASIYASTKLMQEYLLTQAGEHAEWRATILRFQNVYGPGQSLHNPYTGVLSIFANQLLEGKEIAIFEDGKIARDFVFVDDVVAALIAASEREIPHGTIIDIGNGEATTILEAARILMRALNISDNNYRITGQFRVGDIRYACADIHSAKTLLQWTPKTQVAEGLQQLAMWAKAQHSGGNN